MIKNILNILNILFCVKHLGIPNAKHWGLTDLSKIPRIARLYNVQYLLWLTLVQQT